MPIAPRKYYLGVDPGWSGEFIIITSGKNYSTYVARCPGDASDKDLYEWLKEWAETGTLFATIEKVQGFIGTMGQPASAAFKFGHSFGRDLMALTAANIPFEEVIPHMWQKRMGIPSRRTSAGESQKDWKNRLKEHAQRLFPVGIKITLANADALLIAEYTLRKKEGGLI